MVNYSVFVEVRDDFMRLDFFFDFYEGFVD